MHVLWISDSPDTPSGFGNVTRFVCAGLARLGHRVSILGWQAHESCEWQGCKVFPIGSDPLGSDAMFGLLVRHRPDAVIALGDVWWLPFFNAPHVRRQMELTKTPWLLYFPIDGDTEQERLPASWIEVLREVDVPIAMSLYGQRVAQRCGIASGATCQQQSGISSKSKIARSGNALEPAGEWQEGGASIFGAYHLGSLDRQTDEE